MSADEPNKIVHCPFVKLTLESGERASTGFWEFVGACVDNGLDRIMAIVVALRVTQQQKGLLSALTFQPPDFYRLDEVNDISHADLYNKHIGEVQSRIKEASVSNDDGTIHFDLLVDLKKWIADQEKVEISKASKLETCLVFLRSGGNLETGKVKAENVLTLLRGQRPEGDVFMIDFDNVRKAKDMCKWNDTTSN